MKKKFVIKPLYPGLGDNLFYSSLPRLIKESSKEFKVYISSNNRSNEIDELIWSFNPYIDGFTSGPNESPLEKIEFTSKDNIICRHNKNYGIDCMPNIEPEIHYIPKKIDYLSDVTLVDLNYKSFIGSISNKKILSYLKKEPNVYFINPPDWINDSNNVICSESLKQYVDMIYSSKNFICFTSGGATLAAAIQKPSTCYYGNGQNKIFHHSKIHKYVDVGDYSLLGYLKSIFLKLRNKLRVLIQNEKKN